MIELKTLGALRLLGQSNHDFDAVLAQPKRLALLVYLAVAHRGGFARRDSLVGLFWPDLDDAHARSSLRQSLTFLRRALGDDVLARRGTEDIGIDDSVLETDAVLFDRACDAGDAHGALQLYRGELLEGVFVSDVSPDLERWIEDQRARLRTRAGQVAWKLVTRYETEGNLELAAEYARRAVALAPQDERGLRRLMLLLDRDADQGGAVRAYETFARRLAADLEVEPARETTDLMTQVRSRLVVPAMSASSLKRARPVQSALRREVSRYTPHVSRLPDLPLPQRATDVPRQPPPPHWWSVAAGVMLAVVAGALVRSRGDALEDWWRTL
jgi:serine/threonine-protein kinase